MMIFHLGGYGAAHCAQLFSQLRAEYDVIVVRGGSYFDRSLLVPRLLAASNLRRDATVYVCDPDSSRVRMLSEKCQRLVDAEKPSVGFRVERLDRAWKQVRILFTSTTRALADYLAGDMKASATIVLNDYNCTTAEELLSGAVVSSRISGRDHKLIIATSTLGPDYFEQFASEVSDAGLTFAFVDVADSSSNKLTYDSSALTARRVVDELLSTDLRNHTALVLLPTDSDVSEFITSLRKIRLSIPDGERSFAILDCTERDPVTMPSLGLRVIVSTHRIGMGPTLDVDSVFDSGREALVYQDDRGVIVHEQRPSRASALASRASIARRVYRVFVENNEVDENPVPIDMNVLERSVLGLSANGMKLSNLLVPSGQIRLRQEEPRIVSSLQRLGCFESDGALSEMGRFASTLDVQPRYAAMIWRGIKLGCALEAAALAASLELGEPLGTDRMAFVMYELRLLRIMHEEWKRIGAPRGQTQMVRGMWSLYSKYWISPRKARRVLLDYEALLTALAARGVLLAEVEDEALLGRCMLDGFSDRIRPVRTSCPLPFEIGVEHQDGDGVERRLRDYLESAWFEHDPPFHMVEAAEADYEYAADVDRVVKVRAWRFEGRRVLKTTEASFPRVSCPHSARAAVRSSLWDALALPERNGLLPSSLVNLRQEYTRFVDNLPSDVYFALETRLNAFCSQFLDDRLFTDAPLESIEWDLSLLERLKLDSECIGAALESQEVSWRAERRSR